LLKVGPKPRKNEGCSRLTTSIKFNHFIINESQIQVKGDLNGHDGKDCGGFERYKARLVAKEI
jgi:hypothetical protein